MAKLTRDYYPISEAAKLIGLEENDLLHLGAMGSLNVYVMAQNWRGEIFDFTFFFQTTGGIKFYKSPFPPEHVTIEKWARLTPDSIRLFEGGIEEVRVSSTWYSDNTESGKTRLVNLDKSVTIKRSQLFVLTDDINEIDFDSIRQGLGDNEKVENDSKPSLTDERSKGLNKHAIALAFADIYWSHDQWLANLPCNPKWLVGEEGVVAVKGRPGKGGETLWNPAKVAIQLYGRNKQYLSALKAAFRKQESLAPWVEEWKTFVQEVAWFSK